MYDEKVNCYKTDSADHIRKLAGIAGIIFSGFVGISSWILDKTGWQWIAGFIMAYVIYNVGLSWRRKLPGIYELLFNLCICTGLTYLQAAYSSILFQMLLLRMAIKAGRQRTRRMFIIIGTVYLGAAIIGARGFTLALAIEVLYNFVVFAVLTHGVIQIDTLVAKQGKDDKKMLELIKQNDHNYRLAFTDALTGLYNHRAYKQKIEDLDQYVLLIIDIDHFKKLNDSWGHLVGDKVLVMLGNMIKLSVRGDDLAFRYGGEEFVIVLPGSNAQTGMKIAERLRQKVAEASFDHGVGRIHLTVSIGMSVKKQGMSSQTVFEQADNALYQVKQSGRNQVRAYAEPVYEVG